jgi:CRISPR-associated protein Cmr4
MQHHLFHLHALSALHPGTGQAVGAVDLPIARERASGLPYFPGSSLKGVLRDRCAADNDCERLFGPERIAANEDAFAGALAIGDASLLLLPVRSMAGVMAWATCPFVLRRYAADRAIFGATGGETNSAIKLPPVPTIAPQQAFVAEPTCLRIDATHLVIDDLDLEAQTDAATTQWAQLLRDTLFPGDEQAKQHFDKRFTILSDDDFGFLAETATEVRARIRIDDATGTVARGALWYEENLPAETVLWGLIGIGPSRAKDDRRKSADMQRAFVKAVGPAATLQLGGKASVGRGLARFALAEA